MNRQIADKTLVLRDLVTIEAGYTIRGRVEHDPEGDHCIVQMSNVSGPPWRIEEDGLSRLAGARPGKRHCLRKGDILFVARGPRNYAVLVENDMPRTIASAIFFILRTTTSSILPGWLVWYLNQERAAHYFRTHASGTVLPCIFKGDLGGLPVPLPSLALQEQIVAVERLLSAEEELTARLRERRALLARGLCRRAIEEEGEQTSHHHSSTSR